MARYQVILTYDGAGFQGFQRQAKARTVQSEVESALRHLSWQGKTILAAGRTDAGVHALGQVVAFDLDWNHSPQDLQHALNALLPEDIAAHQVRLVHSDFHPRYDAISRCYCYRVFCSEVRDPLRERYAWRVWPEVDVQRMNLAASYLIGKHDFVAFGKSLRAHGITRRTVYQATWQSQTEWKTGFTFNFEIVADAFLYHMVRRLVFFQVEVGQGIREPEDVQKYLTGLELNPPQGIAPPCGLTLVEVAYPSS